MLNITLDIMPLKRPKLGKNDTAWSEFLKRGKQSTKKIMQWPHSDVLRLSFIYISVQHRVFRIE